MLRYIISIDCIYPNSIHQAQRPVYLSLTSLAPPSSLPQSSLGFNPRILTSPTPVRLEPYPSQTWPRPSVVRSRSHPRLPLLVRLHHHIITIITHHTLPPSPPTQVHIPMLCFHQLPGFEPLFASYLPPFSTGRIFGFFRVRASEVVVVATGRGAAEVARVVEWEAGGRRPIFSL